MKTKHTFMLIILVLVFGFTNAPGIGKNQDNASRVSETQINPEFDAELNCRLQTKSSTVRRSIGGNLTVSINTSYSCR